MKQIKLWRQDSEILTYLYDHNFLHFSDTFNSYKGTLNWEIFAPNATWRSSKFPFYLIHPLSLTSMAGVAAPLCRPDLMLSRDEFSLLSLPRTRPSLTGVRSDLDLWTSGVRSDLDLWRPWLARFRLDGASSVPGVVARLWSYISSGLIFCVSWSENIKN